MSEQEASQATKEAKKKRKKLSDLFNVYSKETQDSLELWFMALGFAHAKMKSNKVTAALKAKYTKMILDGVPKMISTGILERKETGRDMSKEEKLSKLSHGEYDLD